MKKIGPFIYILSGSFWKLFPVSQRGSWPPTGALRLWDRLHPDLRWNGHRQDLLP